MDYLSQDPVALGRHALVTPAIVLVADGGSPVEYRENGSFAPNRGKLRGGPAVGDHSNLVVLQRLAHSQLPGRASQDRFSILKSWGRERDFPVEATRTAQCDIDVVGTIRGGDHDNVSFTLEPVHKREELAHNTLRYLVRIVIALTCDAIDLVKEDDCSLVLTRGCEELPQQLLAFAIPLTEDRRAADLVKRRIGVVGDDAREHRLAGAGISSEQDALDWASPDLSQLGVAQQRQFDQLARPVLDLVKTSKIVECLGAGGINAERRDDGIVDLSTRSVTDGALIKDA